MAKVLNAKVVKPREFNVKDIKKYDVIGFGSGIYDYKHHRAILELTDKLPDLKKKKVFIFSTAGITLPKFHNELKERLQKKNANIVDEFSCKGFNKNDHFKGCTLFEKACLLILNMIGGMNKGRPNSEDFKNAENFAKKIKEEVKAGK